MVATPQLAGGSKVAAGAVQTVALSEGRGVSPRSLLGFGQSAEISYGVFLNSNEKHKKFQFCLT